MPLQVQPTPNHAAPYPLSGSAPVMREGTAHAAQRDAIATPRAHPAIPVSPPPRHIVNGTPEVALAGLGLAGLAVGADLAALSTLAAVRAGGSYVARLAQSVVHCVADPAKTGEHIAEGLVGGAAWAGAAAGVGALAEAARQHATSPIVAPR